MNDAEAKSLYLRSLVDLVLGDGSSTIEINSSGYLIGYRHWNHRDVIMITSHHGTEWNIKSNHPHWTKIDFSDDEALIWKVRNAIAHHGTFVNGEHVKKRMIESSILKDAK